MADFDRRGARSLGDKETSVVDTCLQLEVGIPEGREGGEEGREGRRKMTNYWKCPY